jgi:natural product precursor
MFHKKNETKKLTLKRETLRDLTNDQMKSVAGGYVPSRTLPCSETCHRY